MSEHGPSSGPQGSDRDVAGHNPGAARPRIPVDGHVHFHDRHDLSRLLSAARDSFLRLSRADAAGPPHPLPVEPSTPWDCGVLCLTEDARHAVFSSLVRGERQVAGWSWETTDEPASLRARDADGRALLVLSGFQAVTREGLEVLALATTVRPPEGRALGTTVDAVAASGAVPVLPWALGKWWFGRGERLRAYLAEAARPPLGLGDNAGRAPGLPGPTPSALAQRFGLVVLPGSDPLPLPGRETRAGSYGFWLPGPISGSRPASDFRAKVAAFQTSPASFGSRSSWVRLVRDQLALRLSVRRDSAGARP